MEKWLSGRARRGVAGGSESRWRPGASPEAQGKGHWQQVEGGGPSPLLCPALGCPGQDRHGQTGENPPALPTPLSVGLGTLVSWSQQPPETAGRSCAGTQQRCEEAGSARQHCPATATSTPLLLILAVAGCAASLLCAEGPPVPGGMGQASCCCGSRWAPPAARGHAGTPGPRTRPLSHARRSLLCREALTGAEPVLSADVRLTRGRKRSERRLLLLPEELVVAKLR